jgi:CRISPR/Cas system CMR subunit Cmr4 (Cas7 group RAMP superfamily)
MISNKSILLTATSEIAEKGIETLIEKAIERMMEKSLQNAQNLIRPDSPAAMLEVVKTHETYVRQLHDDAIQESRKYIDSSSSPEGSNDERSHVLRDTSGPAFHQLGYSSVRGTGWWN